MIGYNMISNHYCVQNMNYKKVYDDLIAKCQSRQSIDGYKERHHITPRSMNGSNDPSNLVDLTAREHFIAHFLLAKIHGGTQWYAIRRMRGNDGFYINSRLYEIARKEIAKEVGKRMTGIPKTNEQKAKMSASAIGKKKSPEAVEKTRQANLGRKPNEAQLAALHANRQLAWTPEAQAKKSAKTKGVARPYAKNSIPPSIEVCVAGGKAGKGRKQTPEQIAKRVASRRATLMAQGRTV
jgi:hypothetical protein